MEWRPERDFGSGCGFSLFVSVKDLKIVTMVHLIKENRDRKGAPRARDTKERGR